MLYRQKIIFVSNTSWTIYKFRLNLLISLKALGFQIILVASFDETTKKLREHGFDVITLNIDRKGVNPVRDLSFVFSLYRVYRKNRPDLIVHYTIKPNIYGTVAAKFSGIPSFAVTTGLGYVFINDSIISKIARFLYKFAFKFTYTAFFLNEDDRKIFIDNNIVSMDKTEILPGEGLDCSYYRPNERRHSEMFRFLFIGRLIIDKGIYEFVEASKKIGKHSDTIQCAVLGGLDPDYPAGIKKAEIIQWEEEGIVRYLGTTDDIREILGEYDCVVLPSYREGLPRVLLEAASMAIPIVATDVPGCRDVVLDGYNGLLCKARNVDDLTDKMIAIYNLSWEDRRRMGENGRNHVLKNFDDSIILEKYLQVLRKLYN